MPTKRKAPKAARRKIASGTKTKADGGAKAKAKTKAKTKTKAQTKAAPRAGRQSAAPASKSSAPQARAPSSPRTIFEILHPGATGFDPSFRDAPDGWTPDHARALATTAGLDLTEDHWEVIRVLQGCYKDEVAPRIRLLRDALEARFASKGGIKYLFAILPGGPIAQGCALAGLKPPHGARDLSFGSVA
jgi:TusE/DsrC/DsvC family sulfur relay protein